MKNLMIDIETWGKAAHAVIISIGAVKFDPTDTNYTDEFHVAITPRGQEFYKRKIDADTVMWWMDPDRTEAWAHWTAMEKTELVTALDGFAQWIGTDAQDVKVWGNGVSFDNVIVQNAYMTAGLETPWYWGNDRCFRTVKNLAPRSLEPIRLGTYHDALDDARHQTTWLLKIAEHLNIAL